MNISESSKVTVIELSRAELRSLHITYEGLFGDRAHSKRVIFSIVNQALSISGNKRAMPEDTRIDLLPDGEGGCLIILDSSVQAECFIYMSEQAESLMDYARLLKGSTVPESSLYKWGEVLFLAVFSDAEDRRINEFAFFYSCSRLELERIREYGCALIEKDALEILGGFASEK